MLRPTAAPNQWQKFVRYGATMSELFLIGWTHQDVRDKLLPLLLQRQKPQEQQDNESETTTSTTGTSCHEGRPPDSCLFGHALQQLYIVSTELWTCRPLRSPHACGTDSITAQLLLSQLFPQLHTLSISRSCVKADPEWQTFCRTVSQSLPCLKRLELRDASNVYNPPPSGPPSHSRHGPNNRSNPQPQQQQNPDLYGLAAPLPQVDSIVNVSYLFQCLAETRVGLPLQILKVHLNSYHPGQLDLGVWTAFATRYQTQLEEISLHMIDIVTDPCTTHAIIPKPQPTIGFSRLRDLHLTFVNFDHPSTWQQFFFCSSTKNNSSSSVVHEGGLVTCRLETLTLVCPSLTHREYQSLWSHLFVTLPHVANSNNDHSLQTTSSSCRAGPHGLRVMNFAMTPSVYKHLSLRVPASAVRLCVDDPPTTVPLAAMNHRNSNPFNQVHAQLRHGMYPSLTCLLDCWYQQPPGTYGTVHEPCSPPSRCCGCGGRYPPSRRLALPLVGPYELSRQDSNARRPEQNATGLLRSSGSAAEWQAAQDVWNLYQTIAFIQNKCQEHPHRDKDSSLYTMEATTNALVQALMVPNATPAAARHSSSLDCIFHLVRYLVPTLVLMPAKVTATKSAKHYPTNSEGSSPMSSSSTLPVECDYI